MGMFSEVLNSNFATNLRKVLLAAEKKNKSTQNFVGKHIYPLYLECMGEAYESTGNDGLNHDLWIRIK